MQFLYQCDIVGLYYFSQVHFTDFIHYCDIDHEVMMATQRIVEGTLNEVKQIDAEISNSAHKWELKRIAFVDRAILRLATYELKHTETPKKVIINEAIELAKKFGENKSKGFINGLLDSLSQNMRDS